MIDKCYDNQDDYFFDCPGDFYCSALSDDDICCDCATDKRINNEPVFRLNKRGDGREHVQVLCKSNTIAGEIR